MNIQVVEMWRTRYVGRATEFPCLLPVSPCVHQPRSRSAPNHLLLGFLMEVTSCKHDLSWTSFPTPLPSLENGGWGGKFQASNHGLVFLVSSPSQEPPRSLLRVTSLEQETLLSPRKVQGIQEPNVRDRIFKQKMFLVLISLRILLKFQELCQEPGTETSYVVFIISYL